MCVATTCGRGTPSRYVPHQTIADSRTEDRRKNAVAYRTVAGASPPAVTAVRPARNVRINDPGQATSSQRERIWRHSATS
jgi:hypothetical protein